MKSTLLLNASYEPLRILSYKDAMRLLLKNKATVLDESPYSLETCYDTYTIPYVIILNYQAKVSPSARQARFSRKGVLVRDHYTCAYCGKYGDTIDHVWPRSLGGKSTYENCVTSCRACNHKKSNKTLKELGWELPKEPKTPNKYQDMLKMVKPTDAGYETWHKYISYYLPTK
jgi:5-methylcytosine-specific restriction endonuclease McrA